MERKEGASVARAMSKSLKLLAAIATVAALGACAEGEGGYGGDPGAASLSPGQSCGTIRQQLDALDRKGTQAKVEAASAGKKLAPKDKSDVDQYNTLLNQYLGARCHA